MCKYSIIEVVAIVVAVQFTLIFQLQALDDKSADPQRKLL